RMIRGQRPILILQHEREMNVVAGAPDAAFAVDMTLDAGGDALAADVEVADRERDALLDLQVAFLSALLRDERKRRFLERQLRETLRVGFEACKRLPLKIERLDARARERLGGPQVGRNDDPTTALILLREQTDIRDEDVARVSRAMLVVGVVRVLTRIVAIRPIRAVVHAEVLFDVVPVAVVGEILRVEIDERFFLDRRRTFAGIDRAVAIDRDAQPHEPIGILLQELRDVQAVAIPSRKIRGVERNRLTPQVAADAAELVRAAERIDLPDLRYLVVVAAKCGRSYAAHARPFERHRQGLRFRQDRARADEFHLRLRAREHDGIGGGRLERAAETIANAALDGERERTFRRAIGIDAKHVAVDARA